MTHARAEVGVVAIGRNEGERLRACLGSVCEQVEAVVYVDSASTDDSVAIAEALGVRVVHLDPEKGFTAGKARNLGATALIEADSPPEFIQFIDGDCILVEGWLDAAIARLRENPSLAVVAGRRRELYPGASVFNRLCDMEWNTPVGYAAAVGGDALYRRHAFVEAGGFDPAFICGEEPELCFRLRQADWRIERIDADMTRHDAAMTRLSQWWRRTVRTGWAFAEGARTYGASEEGYNRREALRIALWGVIYPLLLVVTALTAALVPGLRLPALAAFVALALLVPLMVVRIAGNRHRDYGDPWSHSFVYGFFVLVGKVPEAVGAWRYLRLGSGRQARIIEYK